MTTVGKASQNRSTKPTAARVIRKPKSSVVPSQPVSDAQIKPQAFKVGQRVRFVKTGNIGKVTSVVTDQDGIVVNECRVGGLWYGFNELGEV